MSPMSREYPPVPLVGVGAVVWWEGKCLLVRRGKDPGYGEWSIPGGAVQVGESVRDALRREVYEETGLRVQVNHLIDVVDRIVHDDEGRVRYHYVLLDYACDAEQGSIRPSCEILEARWVDLEDLAQYPLPEITRAVILGSRNPSPG